MIGSFAFLSPWMLVALAPLILVYLILRLLPPRALQLANAAWFRFRASGPEKTPARTPWWLTLLRILLLACIIMALAEPVLRPEARLTTGSAPLLLVLDNGWDSAPDFGERVKAAETALAEAARDSRPVAFVATAEPRAESLAAGTAEEAGRRLAVIEPRPYLPARGELAERLAEAFQPASADVLWIGGLLDDGEGAALATALQRIAVDGALVQSRRPLTAMRPPSNAADAVHIPVTRLGGLPGPVAVAGFDQEGRRIMEGSAEIGSGGEADVQIALPAEIRNSLVRLVVSGEDSAGAVQLLDGRWRRRPTSSAPTRRAPRRPPKH